MKRPSLNRATVLLAIPLALLFVAGPAWAGELSCEKAGPVKEGLLDGIESSYQKMHSIQATFVQISFFAGLDRREVSKGEVSFLKPGKMDWNYTEPEPQRFVSDGKTISFFQPKLNQVTLTDFSNAFSSDVPVTFLLGIGSLKKSFDAVSSCPYEGGVLLELKPKSGDAALSNFFLLVDGKSLTPLGAKVIDLGGNETTIRLLTPKYNDNINVSHFGFEIPKGVDVIDNRTGKTETPSSVKEETITP